MRTTLLSIETAYKLTEQEAYEVCKAAAATAASQQGRGATCTVVSIQPDAPSVSTAGVLDSPTR